MSEELLCTVCNRNKIFHPEKGFDKCLKCAKMKRLELQNLFFYMLLPSQRDAYKKYLDADKEVEAMLLYEAEKDSTE